VLGENARQAGSSVTPDRFRFDFNHPEAMTPEQVERVEKLVNEAVAADYVVKPVVKSREQAVAEGAMALFGEKYGDTVRTITIGDKYSYELCGGTHLDRTSDVGVFIIISETSAAAGVRRIEAVTGRGAYELIARRFKILDLAAQALKSGMDDVPAKIQALQVDLDISRKERSALRTKQAFEVFNVKMANVEMVMGIPVLAARIDDIDADMQRLMTDRFKQTYSGGTVLLASVVGDKVNVIAAVSDDLVKRGLKAGDLIVGIGGRGGGRPNMAQGSLPEPSQVDEALKKVIQVVEEKTK
jgi:alanyl-tRNA synthetase